MPNKKTGDIETIKKLYYEESLTLAEIAEIFGVSAPAIYYRLHPDKNISRSIFTARINAINILGKKCSKCGFSDFRALQIDHINGGGNKESKQIGGYAIYLKIINNPEKSKLEYQILCANCNWIKRYENKEVRNGVRYNDYEDN